MTNVISAIRNRLRGAQGVTLIELLVVCLTAGVLGGAMLGVYESLIRSAADTEHRIVNQDDARTAMNEIARYVRMAESSASNLTSTSDAVALAQPQELVFYADIDGNGLPEKVRYYLSGKTLRMATLAPDTLPRARLPTPRRIPATASSSWTGYRTALRRCSPTTR